jgi:hypothetical protein
VAVSVDDVAVHLGFMLPAPDPDAIQRVLDAATAIITPHLSVTVVPFTSEQVQVIDLSILRICSELWAAQSTPTGTVTFADGSEGLQPVLRDAYYAVEANLQRAGVTAWPAVIA